MIDMRRIQHAFYLSTSQRYELLVPNVYLDYRFHEMDLCGVRKSGFVDEIEIKRSVSDFKADFKKTVLTEIDSHINDDKYKGRKVFGAGYGKFVEERPKHECLQEGLNNCNYFSFLIPKEIENKCDIPEYAGLYVYYESHDSRLFIAEVKSAPRLHKRKISDNTKYKLARKMAYRYWDSQAYIIDRL